MNYEMKEINGKLVKVIPWPSDCVDTQPEDLFTGGYDRVIPYATRNHAILMPE